MAKVIHSGKSHGVWVLPCNGISHSSMAKSMGAMEGNIHGFCHTSSKKKIPKIISIDWLLWLHIMFSLSLEYFNHGDASIFPDLSFRQTNSAQYIFSLHNMFRHSGPDHVLHSTGKFDKYFSSTFQISESEISVKNRLDNRNTKKWK